MSADIEPRLRKIVSEHLDVDPNKIQEHSDFIGDLGADSLDTVELVMAFEEEFGIEISDEAAEETQTFGQALTLVTKLAA
jgi:acyl carrier protein